MHSMGYSIFTFDLRGHGVSDKAKVGLGVKEISDILLPIIPHEIICVDDDSTDTVSYTHLTLPTNREV